MVVLYCTIHICEDKPSMYVVVHTVQTSSIHIHDLSSLRRKKERKLSLQYIEYIPDSYSIRPMISHRTTCSAYILEPHFSTHTF